MKKVLFTFATIALFIIALPLNLTLVESSGTYCTVIKDGHHVTGTPCYRVSGSTYYSYSTITINNNRYLRGYANCGKMFDGSGMLCSSQYLIKTSIQIK